MTDIPQAADRDALAEVFSRHRYALGHDGVVSDGEFAWLDCTCGFKQIIELPEDDIRIAEAAWERHLADAVLTVVTDAADVRRQTAEETLREAANFIEFEMAAAWGGNGDWLTTGHHVAGLVAEVLRERAREVGGDRG